MEYDTTRGSLYEQMEELCRLFPNKELGEVLALATDRELYNLSDYDLGSALKGFYFQNM
jgi:hypothetical protein